MKMMMMIGVDDDDATVVAAIVSAPAIGTNVDDEIHSEI